MVFLRKRIVVVKWSCEVGHGKGCRRVPNSRRAVLSEVPNFGKMEVSNTGNGVGAGFWKVEGERWPGRAVGRFSGPPP